MVTLAMTLILGISMRCHLPVGAKAAKTFSFAAKLVRKCHVNVGCKSGGFFSAEGAARAGDVGR